MDLSSILLFGVATANAILGLIVIARNSRNLQYRYYFGLAISIGIWTLANAFFRILPIDALLPVALSAYVGAIFAATFFLLFYSDYAGKRFSKDWFFLAVGTAVALAALVPGVIASGVTGNRAIVTTNGIWVFALILSTFFLLGLRALFSVYHNSTGVKRHQAQIMWLGMLASVGGGLVFNLFLPLFNVYKYVYVGPLFSVVFMAALAYAMIRQRLFDLRLVIARSAAYILLLVTLGVAFSVAFFSVSSSFFSKNSFSSAQLFLNTLLALILAFAFQPLRRFFERITDRIFYHEHYDSQGVLNEFSKILVSELELDKLLIKTLTNLCESLHIQFGQLIIFNHDRVYRVEHYGPLPQRLMVAPELHTLKRSMLIADELTGGARKELMESHGVRVSMMLSSREEFVGYLLLGDKLSGDIYSNQDIELLQIISKELAVAIQNAKAYAEISEFNVTLQARVDHATNRLRAANRHLKELDHAKDEFISMASHQLRTPLTTIKGYLSMMLEGDAGQISDSQKQFVQFAFDASERMVRLISDLLNVSRLSAGRFLIQTKPTDMVAMIDDEVRQLMPHANQKGLKLIFDRPPEPLPPAQIDDNKTRQVVMNFIDNAIYYTPAGEVRVSLSQTGDMVRLEVHDTGIGVPDDAKRKLFSKFYRAGNAQTVRPDGTGLGLYLAKRVIQDQGGTIIFNSIEGKGSTFGFELPMKPPPVHTSSTHHEEHHAASRPAVHQ